MNFHDTCPHCGRRVTAYVVHLNAQLLEAFVLFAEARIVANGPIEKAGLELSHSQYGNFQKLRHFRLIERRESNTWEMTPHGWGFLMGQMSVYSPAAQFGNTTLDADHPAWATHKESRQTVRIGDVLPSDWQQRADYVAQKRGAA